MLYNSCIKFFGLLRIRRLFKNKLIVLSLNLFEIAHTSITIGEAHFLSEIIFMITIHIDLWKLNTMPFRHNLYVSTSDGTLAINVGLRNRTGNLFARIHTEDNDTYTKGCLARTRGSGWMYFGHYDGFPNL